MQNSEIIKDAGLVEVFSPKDLTINAVNVKTAIFGKYLEKDEINNLLRQIPHGNTRHLMLFQFLWRTGVRISEALSVRKKDLDYEMGYMTIRWLKSRKWHERVLPIPDVLSTSLSMYSASMKADELLFPISRQRADQLAKKYGFGHCHLLRHSFAVNFLNECSELRALEILSDWLGHSDIRTTQKYTHVRPKDLKRAINGVKFD